MRATAAPAASAPLAPPIAARDAAKKDPPVQPTGHEGAAGDASEEDADATLFRRLMFPAASPSKSESETASKATTDGGAPTPVPLGVPRGGGG